MSKKRSTKPKSAAQKPAKAVVTHETSRCPKCDSTRRTEYTNRREHEYAGLDADGRPYSAVVWRNTTCLDCGQVRTDRTFEFEPPNESQSEQCQTATEASISVPDTPAPEKSSVVHAVA